MRVLHDGCFWFAASGMAAAFCSDAPSPQRRNQRLAGSLLGLLALVELGWSGSSLLRFAPVESFLNTGPIGAALAGRESRMTEGWIRSFRADQLSTAPTPPSLDPHLRIKARDTFFGDLRAFCLGIEKTNINDVFQLDHSAALYESLYAVASRPRPYRLLMPANEPCRGIQPPCSPGGLRPNERPAFSFRTVSSLILPGPSMAGVSGTARTSSSSATRPRFRGLMLFHAQQSSLMVHHSLSRTFERPIHVILSDDR